VGGGLLNPKFVFKNTVLEIEYEAESLRVHVDTLEVEQDRRSQSHNQTIKSD